MPGLKTKYTAEFRIETADYIISTGRPIAQVAEELGVNVKTASRWVKLRRDELLGNTSDLVDNKELAQLRKRNRELEMENAFLKKAAAFFAKDLQ